MGAAPSLQFAAMPPVEVSHQTLIEEGRKETLQRVSNQGWEEGGHQRCVYIAIYRLNLCCYNYMATCDDRTTCVYHKR